MGRSPSEHQPATACGDHSHQLVAKHYPLARTPQCCQQPHDLLPSSHLSNQPPPPTVLVPSPTWGMCHLPRVLQRGHVIDIEDDHDGWRGWKEK